MKLTALSNYGSKTNEISTFVTIDQIKETMNSINWKDFHQVILEKNNSDYLEVSGNITDDGLSVMYQEKGKQYFIANPPTTVAQMIIILLSYHSGDEKFKVYNLFQPIE